MNISSVAPSQTPSHLPPRGCAAPPSTASLGSTAIATVPAEKLNYDVLSWSSHSATYHPRHIKVNRPTDQGSRWSSGNNNQLQYITLKLDAVAVVQSITFGKYHKVHVCNMREFKIYGGLTPDNMTELLHAGLRNDSEAETFSLKHKMNGVVFPCQYIKIAPHLAWGPNFNFSIWYVELRGIQQSDQVERIHNNYLNYRENEVARLCLKHFRQRNYLDAFEALQNRTQLQLEDPLLTELHGALVVNGDFAASEEIMQQAHDRNLFTEYVRRCSYKPLWKLLKFDSAAVTPSMRGGHQMCMDSDAGIFYLLGGWDGQSDLSDFWSFSVATKQWTCISMDTRREHGPGPRSCHKICFDPATKSIYSLGRYIDQETRPNINLDPDFWRYDVVARRWIQLSSNTLLEGGPDLVYDHQMVIDSPTQTLYSFGGRVICPDPAQITYSGFYTYHIPTNTWRMHFNDTTPPSDPHAVHMKSRIGHSMLLNPLTRQIYIFAGQRNKDMLSDMYLYELDTSVLTELSRDYSKQGGPNAGFTQRATIDPTLCEFYVLSGFQKEKNTTQETAKNTFWCYNMTKGVWARVYHNENTASEYWEKMKETEPCPRYAHQVVYDEKGKVHFVFGGNPGDVDVNARLDDLWELHLLRSGQDDILRHAQFRIRRQQYKELCATGNTLAALQFLKTQVYAAVSHTHVEESAEFRNLAQFLFNWSSEDVVMGSAGTGTAEGVVSGMAGVSAEGVDGANLFQQRTELYEMLLDYFPSSMKEPKGNLVDFIDMLEGGV
ncbi:Muskelin 1, intracellular mediator containing kelch motif [Podochytrium sp. JEL0797]|nr:Muskelin 1, intracellular mediator containing kelch motif [Podochytrium sp. JEL0797]